MAKRKKNAALARKVAELHLLNRHGLNEHDAGELAEPVRASSNPARLKRRGKRRGNPTRERLATGPLPASFLARSLDRELGRWDQGECYEAQEMLADTLGELDRADPPLDDRDVRKGKEAADRIEKLRREWLDPYFDAYDAEATLQEVADRGKRDNPGHNTKRRRGKKKPTWPPMPDGVSVKWSPVNQAWLVMWGEEVLRITADADEVRDYLYELWGTRDVEAIEELIAAAPVGRPTMKQIRDYFRSELAGGKTHSQARRATQKAFDLVSLRTRNGDITGYEFANPSSSANPAMTYGVLPSAESFEAQFAEEVPSGIYGMHLKGSDLDAAEGTVFEQQGSQGYEQDELLEGLGELTEKWEEGDDAAGDLASSIMSTLGYEWI